MVEGRRRVKVRVRAQADVQPKDPFSGDGGDAIFCSKCSRLFYRPRDARRSVQDRPRCPDCQRHRRVTQAVAVAARTPEADAVPRSPARKAVPCSPGRLATPASASRPPSRPAEEAITSVHAASPDKGAPSALLALVRRENAELRRRLLFAGGGDADADADADASIASAMSALQSMAKAIDAAVPDELARAALVSRLDGVRRGWLATAARAVRAEADATGAHVQAPRTTRIGTLGEGRTWLAD